MNNIIGISAVVILLVAIVAGTYMYGSSVDKVTSGVDIYYSFDSPEPLVSNNGVELEAYGSYQFVEGLSGQAVKLETFNSELTTGVVSSLPKGQEDFTINVVVDPSGCTYGTSAKPAPIVVLGGQGSADIGETGTYGIFTGDNCNVYYGNRLPFDYLGEVPDETPMFEGVTNLDGITVQNHIVGDGFIMLSLVKEGNVIKLYSNGNLVDSTTSRNMPIVEQELWINGGDFTHRVRGLVSSEDSYYKTIDGNSNWVFDELSVYDRALSASEISSLNERLVRGETYPFGVSKLDITAQKVSDLFN